MSDTTHNPVRSDADLDLETQLQGHLDTLGGIQHEVFHRTSMDRQAGNIVGHNLIAYIVTKEDSRVTIELKTNKDSPPELHSVRISTLDRGREITASLFERQNGRELSLEDAHRITEAALKALDNNQAAINELVKLVGGHEKFDRLVKLPHHADPVGSLYADLIDKWHERLDKHPIDNTDALIGGFTRVRYLSTDGLADIKGKLGNDLVLTFADKDNAGILNDVGLRDVLDELLKQTGIIARKHLGDHGELGRFAGDELLYVTGDDVASLDRVRSALLEEEELRKRVLESGELPDHLKGKITNFKERVAEAQVLAELQKSMAGLRSLYRSEETKAVSSERFGEWLTEKCGGKNEGKVFQEWLVYVTKDSSPKVSTIAEVAELQISELQVDKNHPRLSDEERKLKVAEQISILSHNLQAYLANKILDTLRTNGDLDNLDIDRKLIETTDKISQSTTLMSTSYASITLRPDCTPYDMVRGIGTAEKLIYKKKWGGNSIPENPVPVDPSIKVRSADKREVSTINGNITEYDDITARLSDPSSTEDPKTLKAQAFRLVCLDPGSDTVLRFSQVQNFAARLVLPINDSSFFTGYRFHIGGFGAFNKGENMAYANSIFEEVMSRFSKHFSDAQLEMRTAGGTGEVYLKGDLRLGEQEKRRIEAELTAVVQDKITNFTELAFYEKQAFKMFATLSGEFTYYSDRQKIPHELGSVRIERGSSVVDGNQKLAEVHRNIFSS